MGGLLPSAQLRTDGQTASNCLIAGSLSLICGVMFRLDGFSDEEATARRGLSLQIEAVSVSLLGQTSKSVSRKINGFISEASSAEHIRN